MQARSTTNIKGIDVSKWQGNIDWNQVKGAGVQFVYMRSTVGMLVDPMFATYVTGVTGVGIPFGVYHYAKPTAPYNMRQAIDQAELFVNTIFSSAGFYGDLMPVVDVEESGGLTTDEIVAWTNAFVDYVKQKTGRDVMFYTGIHFIENHNGFGGKLSYLPLWIAAYERYGHTYAPPNAGGWTEWTCWQYSDLGKITGVTENTVDLDVATSLELLKGEAQQSVNLIRRRKVRKWW